MFNSIKHYKPIHLERFLRMHEERMRKCGCSGCTDFLTVLHSGASLALAHQSELKALKFWSIDWSGYLDEPPKFHATPSPQDTVLHSLSRDERAIASVVDAEAIWQSEYATGRVDVDSDAYWLTRFNALKYAWCVNDSETDVEPNK